MLKVNEEKLLHDYEELVEKRENNFEDVEKQARLYAIERGYDEDKTEQFVAFTKNLEGDGLSDEDKVKLEILDAYVEKSEDLAEDAESEGTDTSDETVSATAYASNFGI